MFNDRLPCGEGLGVGGTPTFDVLQSPPPCPSPTRGEGTLRRQPHLNFRGEPACGFSFVLDPRGSETYQAGF